MAYSPDLGVYKDLITHRGVTFKYAFVLYPADFTGGVVTFHMQSADGTFVQDLTGENISGSATLAVTNPGTPHAWTTISIRFEADSWHVDTFDPPLDYFIRVAINGEVTSVGFGKILLSTAYIPVTP